MSITIRELARLANTSNATVSMVLSGKDKGRVGQARREEILALAKKHGYRSNLQARALSEGRTYRIAVCFDGKLSEYPIIGGFSLYERLALFSEGIQSAGYAIEILQVDTKAAASTISRDLATKNVDGFVFLGWDPALVSRILFSMREKRIPAVASGTRLNDDDLAWTDIDREQSFRVAAQTVMQEGHTDSVLLDLNTGSNVHLLERGFLQALDESGDPNGPDRIFKGKPSWSAVHQITCEALDRYPATTALLLTDNFYAEAVLEALTNHGREPGQSCRVIGFGDTVLADRCTPRLSHYSLRIADQVVFGIETLLEQINHPNDYQPRHRFFLPKYIQRST